MNTRAHKAAQLVLTGILSLPLVDVAIGISVRGNAEDAVDGVGAGALQGGLVRGRRGVGDDGRGLGHRRQCSRQSVLRLLSRLVPDDSVGGGGEGEVAGWQVVVVMEVLSVVWL